MAYKLQYLDNDEVIEEFTYATRDLAVNGFIKQVGEIPLWWMVEAISKGEEVVIGDCETARIVEA